MLCARLRKNKCKISLQKVCICFLGFILCLHLWGLLEPAFTASELNLMMKNFGWPLSPDGLEVL
jgi:hypothetical protein